MRRSFTAALAAAIGLIALGDPAWSQQTFLNLDLETATRGQVWNWTAVIAGYQIAADTSVFHTGAQSLRIANTGAASGTFGDTGQYLPLGVVAGHNVHLAGYIKTSGMTRGFAGFWMRVDGPNGVLAFNNMSSFGLRGTTDWQQFAFDLYVDPSAVDVVLGALQTGDGTAWFDTVTLDIDGIRYVDSPAPSIGPPSPAQLSWLQQKANPFLSPDPTGPLDDLWPVSTMVGKAHIVGLGEGTHGTHEFFLMKHRLLEYLVENNGFTIFAMEANMPEADRVNQYVLTGLGDPAKLLQGLYFWTWNTQEVLNLIEWIRAYNAAGNGPVQFAGFDMQTASVAIQNVEQFLSEAEPDYLATASPVYSTAQTLNQEYSNGVNLSVGMVQPTLDGVTAVWSHLNQNRATYLANFSSHDVDWAIQNALIVVQATTLPIAPSGYYRDQCMAANTDWLLQQNPGARMVLWAHDGHIWKDPQAMGWALAANHGSDYLAIGQIFHSGTYNAIGPWDGKSYGSLTAWAATPSFQGTVEYVFHLTGMPWFLLDLRQVAVDDPGSSWLAAPVQYRMIGAVEEDGFFVSNRLIQDFDVLIFFDQTTPSQLRPFH